MTFSEILKSNVLIGSSKTQSLIDESDIIKAPILNESAQWRKKVNQWMAKKSEVRSDQFQ